MGLNFYGTIEIYQNNSWDTFAEVSSLLPMNYNAYYLLFGCKYDYDEDIPFKPIIHQKNPVSKISQDSYNILLEFCSDKQIFEQLLILTGTEFMQIDWNMTEFKLNSQCEVHFIDYFIGKNWEILFDLLRVLINKFNSENVRIIGILC